MNKAVFLDRDGVINEMVFDKLNNEFVPPFIKQDLKIYEGVIDSLKQLSENEYKLFLVSNQPDYAKGKTGLENLKEVQDELHRILTLNEIVFSGYYYCRHHPDGVIPEYSMQCDCRKPGNYFVKKAITEFDIDVQNSWFVGDRDKDVICGINSGLRTIRIQSGYYEYNDDTDAEFVVENLNQATNIILLNN
jgi:D-glycero-D-manno-heptose 1,7-bisphosphate phosphatase